MLLLWAKVRVPGEWSFAPAGHQQRTNHSLSAMWNLAARVVELS